MAVLNNPAPPSEDGSHHEQQQQQPPTHPPHPLHQHTISNASTATVDIEAWTVSALESLSINPVARGTGNALSIPLDGSHPSESTQPVQMKLRGVGFDGVGTTVTPPRRPPSRRDSIKRREAMRMGKEGSRQRRRWENDHLLHVPGAQPPEPSDYVVRPTYPVLPTVPYQLASYWDRGLRDHVEERIAAFAAHRKAHIPGVGVNSAVPELGHIPQKLRATVKRTPAAKSWLRVLEEPLRQFVVERGLAREPETSAISDSSDEETDPEDEEIVFVGRNGRMRDGKPPSEEAAAAAPWKRASRQTNDSKKPAEKGMVLDTAEDDSGGAFKRWLTHTISNYYGLDSKSVMVGGNPGKRVIFVCAKPKLLQKQSTTGHKHKPSVQQPILPPPLWEMF
ncbi:R3H-associated N-terminal domain-containing protein [Podospora fimiseda]|uniref:R3H-associated N-terminal domain-containing protein n=1 Tax=Podospora fimiseda TaxID=252190 RepID=A0AAN7BP79_9PEZI|nr:R3H-associated N-terminal domain-containing protein [Podospora fimiseda]